MECAPAVGPLLPSLCPTGTPRRLFAPLRVRTCAGAPAPSRVRSGRGAPASTPRAVAPPALALAPCAPLARLRGVSLAPARLGSPSATLRAPVAFALVALATLRLASARPVAPPGPPPDRPTGSGGWLQPRGPARPCGPLFSGPGPRGFCRALRGSSRGPGRAAGNAAAAGRKFPSPAVRFLLPVCLPWFSPAPPRPAAPAGGSRGARSYAGPCGGTGDL